MKLYRKLFGGLLLLAFISCYREKEIKKLLNSKNINEIIEGASEAGQSGNKKYVPLLLSNAADQRGTTMFRFKGYSIYEEKMLALEKIFNFRPPNKITSKVDSTVIKFYINLAQKDQLIK
jgi:hypothetical protein